MEPQQPTAYHSGPPPFSAGPMTSQKMVMDLDCEDQRSNRAASVLSGMSQEDMEAAETLNSLQAREVFGLSHGRVSIDTVRLSCSAATAAATTASSEIDPVSGHIFAESPAGAPLLPSHRAISYHSIHDQSISIRLPRDTVPHTRSIHCGTKRWATAGEYAGPSDWC